MRVYVVVKRSVDAQGHSSWDTSAYRTEGEAKSAVKALHERVVAAYSELFPGCEAFDDYSAGAMKFEVRPKGDGCAFTVVGVKEHDI